MINACLQLETEQFTFTPIRDDRIEACLPFLPKLAVVSDKMVGSQTHLASLYALLRALV